MPTKTQRPRFYRKILTGFLLPTLLVLSSLTSANSWLNQEIQAARVPVSINVETYDSPSTKYNAAFLFAHNGYQDGRAKTYRNRMFGIRIDGERTYCVEPFGIINTEAYSSAVATRTTALDAIQDAGYNATAEELQILSMFGYFAKYPTASMQTIINSYGLTQADLEVATQWYVWETIGGKMQDMAAGNTLPHNPADTGLGSIWVKNTDYSSVYVCNAYTYYSEATVAYEEFVLGAWEEMTYTIEGSGATTTEANNAALTGANDFIETVNNATQRNGYIRDAPSIVGSTCSDGQWTTQANTTYSHRFTMPAWYRAFRTSALNQAQFHINLTAPTLNRTAQTVNLGQVATFNRTAGSTLANFFRDSNVPSAKSATPNYDATNDGVNDTFVWYSGAQINVEPTVSSPNGMFPVVLTSSKAPMTVDDVNLGYIVTGAQNQIILRGSAAQKSITLNVEALKHGSIEITKTSASGTLIPNTDFLVSTSADMASPLGTFTTGANGKVLISDLVPGTYYVQEQRVPAPYVLDNRIYPVVVTANATTDFSQLNQAAQGTITITKSGEGEVLAGTVYNVLNASGTVVQTLTTGANGKATTNRLPLGNYTLVETSVPAPYVLDPTPIVANIVYQNQNVAVVDTSVLQSNIRAQGRIEITKIGDNDVRLAGATYNILNASNAVVGTITTGPTGVGTSNLLPLGNYTLVEMAVPAPYLLKTTPIPVTLAYENQTTPVVTSVVSQTNTRARGQLTLIKEDSETVTPQGEAMLEGAVYEIEMVSSIGFPEEIGHKERITIAKNGTVYSGTSSNRLPLGTYTVKEITAPVGYNLSPDIVNVAVSFVNANQPLVVVNQTVKNDVIKASIITTKEDAQTNQKLENAIFDIFTDYDRNNQIETGQLPLRTVTTDASGQVSTGLLPYGHYIVRENKAPFGYVLLNSEINNHTHVRFIQNQGVNQTVLQTNIVQMGGIAIQKENVLGNYFPWSKSENSLQGAVYNIVAVEMRLPDRSGAPKPGDVVATLTTNAEGMAQTANNALPLGTYDLVEQTPTKDTVKNTSAIRFRIEYEGQQVLLSTMDYQDSSNYSNLIDFYNNANQTLYTDEVVHNKLDKAAPVVLDPSKITVLLGAKLNNGTAVTHQRPQLGRIKITKTIEAYEDTHSGNSGAVTPEEGVKFEVSNHLGEVVETITTNADGIAITYWLPKGEYTVKQVATEEGIDLIDPFVVEVAKTTDMEVHSYSYKNVESSYRLRLLKVDAETNKSIPLAGVSFQLYKQAVGGEPIVLREWASVHPSGYKDYDLFTTNETGSVTLPSEIAHGTYYLQEIKAPTGYFLDPEAGRLAIQVKGAYTDVSIKLLEIEVENIPQKGQIELSKTGLLFKGLKNGELPAAIKALLDKAEYVTQTEEVPVMKTETVMHDVPRMEQKEKTEIIPVLLEDGTPALDGEGNPITQEVPVLDESGNPIMEEVPVVDADGKPVVDTVAKLDGNGKPMTQQVPVLDADGKPVTETKPVLDEKGLPVQTLVEGSLSTKYNQLKEAIFENGFLEGATYELRARERVVGQDGTVHYEKDALVEKIVTTSSGPVSSKELPLGKYYLVEVLAPKGYLIDTKEYDFEFTPMAQNIRLEIEGHAHENIKLEAKILFAKTIEKSVWFKSHEGAHKDVVFALYSKNEIVFQGHTIPKDTLLGFSLIEPSAEHPEQFEGFFGTLLAGDYYIVEVKTNQRYALDPTQKDVTFNYEDADGPTSEIIIEEPTENTLKDVTLQIVKVDSENKDQKLEGSVFELYAVTSEKDKVYIGTYTTDAEGKIHVDNMEVGEYYLEEITPPKGYWTGPEPGREVVIPEDTKDGGEFSIELVNEKTKGKFHKINYDTDEYVEGATLQLIHVVDGKESVVSEWITDGSGVHEVEGLLIVGETYLLREIKAPKGFALSPDIAFVMPNANQQVVTMANKPTTVLLSKASITNSQELPGASMRLTNSKGETVNEWVSTDTPHIMKYLEVGETYTLHEDLAPIGWATSSSIDFVVKDTGDSQLVQMVDEPIMVSFSKKDLTTSEELPGATLQLFNEETGELYAEWISTNEPHIMSLVPVGKYRLVETIAPDGYVTAEEIIVDVTDTGVLQHVEMLDNITRLEVSKLEATTLKLLPGATLQIVDLEGKVLYEWDSTEEAYSITRIPVGNYLLREVKTPEGYATAEDVPFEILDSGEKHSVSLTNDTIKVDISKTDMTTGEELPGATLQIMDQEGNELHRWVSSETPHRIEMLPTGVYTLIETIAPEGYVRAEAIEFEIIDSAVVQQVHMENDVTKLQISKKDLTTKEELPGASLEIADSEGNILHQWISSDKPHYVEMLPVGDYVLTETLAPEGYEIAESVPFEIKETGAIQFVEMFDAPIEAEEKPEGPKDPTVPTDAVGPQETIEHATIFAVVASSALAVLTVLLQVRKRRYK